MSPHHFQFSQTAAQDQREGGYRLKATKTNFPLLENTALYKLVLDKQSIREPHWHPNADELGYCLRGKVLVSFYGNNNRKETFIIAKGEVFFIPSGTLHCIENIGDETAEILAQFSHEEPENFELSSTVGMFSNAVLGNTWGVPSEVFQAIKRPLNTMIAKLEKPSKIPSGAHYPSQFQFNLEASAPLVINEGGSAKTARQNVWPILQRQALYSVRITGIGMREPHWHPETCELGYVESGKGRMSILSPTGDVETYDMNEGDIYFIPKAYPHHIENLRNTELHILIFFDQAMPQDIGFTGSVKSNSSEVLSASLKIPKKILDSLPTFDEDLFFVKKKNPTD